MRAFFCVLLCAVAFSILTAQEDGSDLFDWDIDSLFDEPPPPDAAETPERSEPVVPDNILSSLIARPGITLDSSFDISAGIAPGYSETPWNWDEDHEKSYSNIIGAKMGASIGLTVQISESLRIKSSAKFSIPDAPTFTLNEFFFDYNWENNAFLRGGRYDLNWGLSPNFAFANLLSRVPPPDPDKPNSGGGDAYIVKTDIPIGIGGIQLLAMTRTGMVKDMTDMDSDEIGFGSKYNLAFTWADIDMGAFYHKTMPLRGFASIKTTLPWNMELYTEGILTVAHETWDWDERQYSGTVGFLQKFFGEIVSLNGEVFYNGENDSFWYALEDSITQKDAHVSPFIKGLNLALNIEYSTGLWKSLRFFTQCLYSVEETSTQLVPGLRFDPFKHVVVTLAVPMALGSREGTYYTKNVDKESRPFSVMLGVTINESYSYASHN
ncbi:hypothetical protein FACS1894200_06660 [Spirochaetia bacterium]|nr:hypothetical protein FACS1894200_06660 [Spirochaetia bacterium]